MKCCFYCDKPFLAEKRHYTLMQSWVYCSWYCMLMDCLESGHTFDEIIRWYQEKELQYK